MKAELTRINPAGRYTTAQAADLLGVDRHTITRWHKAGQLRPMATAGRRTYFKGISLIQAYNNH